MGNHTIEELTTEVARIYERAQNETLALIQLRPAEHTSVLTREWMSATQLAEYWEQCKIALQLASCSMPGTTA